MRKRLSHISEVDFDRFLRFAAERPQIVSSGHMLQKLTIFNFVAPVVAWHAHENILEIGCGLGFHSALLTNYGHVTATELQVPGSFVAGDADIANDRAVVFETLAKGEVPFQFNDGQHLPFANGSFDLIFHNSVIEHVPDAAVFNRETARTLKPNGVVICITGTPALCRFRLVREFLLRLPVRHRLPCLPSLHLQIQLTTRLGLLCISYSTHRLCKHSRHCPLLHPAHIQMLMM